MTDDKTYPTHRLSFSERQVDESGEPKLGKPVEVATIWPRSEKQGGIVQWHVQPQNLGEGAWFLLDNERGKQQGKDGFDQAEQEKGAGLERD